MTCLLGRSGPQEFRVITPRHGPLLCGSRWKHVEDVEDMEDSGSELVIRMTSTCHLPTSSESFHHSCHLAPSSVALPHLPLSSAASDIDLLPSNTFWPIVHSRKSRFRNELFPYIHASLMLRHCRLVSFRAAAVV